MAGFTTIQNVGSKFDLDLRNLVNQKLLLGPRILTSLDPIILSNASLSGEEIRKLVRKRKVDGADLIKIMADGVSGKTTLEQQLTAACDEATRLGLRTLVHANSGDARLAAVAGCTQVEHGRSATEDELKLMADQGTFFDPQGGLLMDNYFVNRSKFVGTPFFPTDEAVMVKRYEQSMPKERDLISRSAKVANLKIVFGSDAVAGMHGRNADEFIYRVRDGGMDPMRVLISANSLGALALGMADQIGAIAPGMQADIIALEGDPIKNISAVRGVVFVMKGGVVYKKLYNQNSKK